MFGLPECNTHEYEIATIGDVVKDVHYGTAKKASEDGRYIYIRMNNITYDGELDLTDIKRIDVPEKDIAGCMVQEGDVLFNRTNSKDLVGKTCHFTGNEPMIIAGYIIRLRMNGKVLPEYISTFMNLDRSKKMLYSMAKGAVGQANINAKEVQSIPIVIPPENVQQEFLKLRKQSDKSKFACLKSQFIEVFGDPVENPHGWLTKGLMELGSCKNGMNFGAKDIGVTIKSVGVGDIKDYDNIEDIESLTTISLNEMPSEEYMLKDGDLVFVRSNGNKELVGRCVAVYPHETPVSFSGFCIRFRKESSDVLLDYLLRYLKMPEVRAKMAGRGANIQNLNQKILAALQVPVPPLETQMAYVAFVRQSDKSK